MSTFLDLIPWETKPKAVEQQTESIFWNGGELKIPRLGYLSVSEMDEISSVDSKNALNRLLYETSIELHRAIVPESKEDEQSPWDPKRCFELLLTLHLMNSGVRTTLTAEEKTIEILHNDIILPFLESAMVHTNRVTIRSATVILKRTRPDWSDELTMQLPGELRKALYEFYLREQQAGSGKLDPEEDLRALEDMLGKPLGASPLTAIVQTGENSFGNAEGFGQEPQSSVESSSAISQAGTSSKRSRRVTKQSAKDSIIKKDL